MYKRNINDPEEGSLSDIDLIDGINDVMRSVRQEQLERERDRGDKEEVYFLETRKDFFPLQLICSHRGRK